MSRATDKLTDIAIRQAKPREKAYKLQDGGQMYLLVKPDGHKYWMMDYKFQDKRNTATFGSYPEVSLKQARKARQDAKELLSQGISPNQHKKQQKQAYAIASDNLFKTVALEWHTKRKNKWDPHHAQVIWRRIEMHVLPILGERPLDSLRTIDLIQPLLALEKQQKLTLAGQVRQYIAGIMRQGVHTGRIEINPANDLKDAIATPKIRHYPALPLTQLHKLKAHIDLYPHNPIIRNALKFALLTGARSSEFRFARWEEFDIEKAEWVIPSTRQEVKGIKHSQRGEKTKNTRIIPLAKQTIDVLNELHKINGKKEFVFTSPYKRLIPLSENSPNTALRRMGYDTANDICLHGFRTMASSALNESGLWQPDAIERHLGHKEPNKIRGSYTHRAEYLLERRAMLQWWADYLDAVILKPGLHPIEFKNNKEE